MVATPYTNVTDRPGIFSMHVSYTTENLSAHHGDVPGTKIRRQLSPRASKPFSSIRLGPDH